MATALQTNVQITIEEYLHTDDRPDREYIDGTIEKRHVGERQHARLQSLIAAWFDLHQKEWACIGSTEQRIRVSPSRIRVPDLVILPMSLPPNVLTDPPLLIIEILFPEDTYAGIQRRCTDYRAMGVRNIWIIDPETRTARTIQGDSWTESIRPQIPYTAIHLDLPHLFTRLDETA